MSDLPPPPPGDPPPPAASGAAATRPTGPPPDNIGGVYYSIGLTILLMIVTLGIWGFFWTYRTSEDLKRYNGEGLGGVLGAVLYFLVHVVLMFTIPNEIDAMYKRAGRASPISAIWGLWFLLPLVGNIVWYVKVQRSLNDFWSSVGSRPA